MQHRNKELLSTPQNDAPQHQLTLSPAEALHESVDKHKLSPRSSLWKNCAGECEKDERYGRYRTYFTEIVDEVGTVGISNAHLHPRLESADLAGQVGISDRDPSPA